MLPININIINFSDLSFIFRFLPVFLIAYYIFPYSWRKIVLAVGSLIFYAIGDWRSLGIFTVSIIVNYLFIAGCKERKKAFLFLVIVFDAAILIAFKLLSQYCSGFSLPMGISFFTFKMISFQVDLYRGVIRKEPGLWDTIAYFSMFPQVISGPIMRYDSYEKNDILSGDSDMFLVFKDRLPIYLSRLESGLFWFALGFSMKVLLADYFAMMWNEIGTIGYESISTPLAWAGVVGYSLNLYYDFWGYSLMAAGVGVALGFPFVENFHHPYASKSVSEFYRRWHMTLGNWFKDYVYFPMGGSRKGELRTVINLFAVWFLTGVWHGVTPNFLIWSGCLFLLICSEKFLISGNKKVLSVVGRVHVLVLIPITWLIFALTSFTDLSNYILRMFPVAGEGINVNPGDFAKITGQYLPFLIAGLILLIPGIFEFVNKYRKHPITKILVLILFWLCTCVASTKAGNPFMYFNF